MTAFTDLTSRVRAVFGTAFGYEPTLTVQAPGRVNLIGEHTDYNDGFVLPCAIDYQTVICAAPRADRQIRVVAADYGSVIDQFSLDGDIAKSADKQWANYVRGVVKHLLKRDTFGGADLAIGGNVPQGAGLSSSASLEVAVGQAMKSLYNLPLSATELALNGQEAENQFVGCNCGIMDQLISAQGKDGHALLIDCRSLETQPVAMPAGVAVLIVNSNVRRGLVESEYNTRRIQCEMAARYFGVKALRDVSLAQLDAATDLDPMVKQRARHVITENDRTEAAAIALSKGDLATMAVLMEQSHASMRDDFAITHPAIDHLVELIKTAVGPAGGVRMTGGGFGGCVVALLPEALVETAKAAIDAGYQVKTGLPATIYVCHPRTGAGVVTEA